MQRKALVVSVLATAVLFAAFAIAVGPENLTNLGSPNDGTRPQPEAGPIGTPTWSVGDSWTYDVNASTVDDTAMQTSGLVPALDGTVTRTVVSTDDGQYNVTVSGTFELSKTIDLSREVDFGNATIALHSTVVLDDATVEGYTLYRASDLAKLSEARTVHLSGSLYVEVGDYSTTIHASYSARVETTYDPPLDVWSFPIEENEAWQSASNATVRVWKMWRLDAPDWYVEKGRNFTFTVPVRLSLSSGMSEDVTTPAGTFSAIPVGIGPAVMNLETATDQMAFAARLGEDPFGEPHAPTTAWFSGDVGNVVKAVTLVDGLRVTIELTSFEDV